MGQGHRSKRWPATAGRFDRHRITGIRAARLQPPLPRSILMVSPSQALAIAIQHHKAGRLPDAEAVYGAILRQVPDAADALYLWGVARGQRGDRPMAELLCRQAVEREAKLRLFDAELGAPVRARGDFDHLARLFAADVALRPGCRLLARSGSSEADPSLRPQLKDVTLCCIDTFYHDHALVALKNCLAQCRFEDVLFLTDREFGLPTIRSRVIDRLPTSEAYSRFVLKELHRHIETPYVLIVQWDGFILDARLWSEEYKAYDYIGARWTLFDDAANVGNGGFSLRSRRLLEATADPEVTELHPEDYHLCRTHRRLLQERYGITYAPPALADRFSVERVATGAEIAEPVETFGFHSLFRMHRVLDPDQLENFLDNVPPSTLKGGSMILLGVSYLNTGRSAQARTIASRILRMEPEHKDKDVLLQILKQAGS
ncbi:tetratricopeptide repeat protein (plasmid) [Azospirillum sp. TSA2s]|nr:tetratricopeptide repeat protein [Azospirillum sp. TSA2s]